MRFGMDTLKTNVVPLSVSHVTKPHTVFETCALVQRAIRESTLTYKIIAARAAVQPTTVSRLASGDTKEPRMSTVIKIMVALGYTLTFERESRL